MSRALVTVFLVCLVAWPVACARHDTLPGNVVALPEIATIPRQQPVEVAPFVVQQGGVQYTVEPMFDYVLDGLVVSRRTHDGDQMLHRLWGDHLNVADLCVVWGKNATDVDLARFDFESGQFTCFYRTSDDAAWRSFRQSEIANNHLLTNDASIRDRIEDVEVGDQVRFAGYLARYSNDKGFNRGTSVTREDTGNGACETVYVKSFAVTRASRSNWRALEKASLGGLFLSAAIWLIGVGRGTF